MARDEDRPRSTGNRDAEYLKNVCSLVNYFSTRGIKSLVSFLHPPCMECAFPVPGTQTTQQCQMETFQLFYSSLLAGGLIPAGSTVMLLPWSASSSGQLFQRAAFPCISFIQRHFSPHLFHPLFGKLRRREHEVI